MPLCVVHHTPHTAVSSTLNCPEETTLLLATLCGSLAPSGHAMRSCVSVGPCSPSRCGTAIQGHGPSLCPGPFPSGLCPSQAVRVLPSLCWLSGCSQNPPTRAYSAPCSFCVPDGGLSNARPVSSPGGPVPGHRPAEGKLCARHRQGAGRQGRVHVGRGHVRLTKARGRQR